MANLTEIETYEPGIYQLETSDKLMGGADGVSNRQAAQLANRTAWLKAHNVAMSSGTFTATLHMHSDPTNTTGTNVTAAETGSYVRVGDMVWITLEFAVNRYTNHVLKHITGLPFPAAKKSVFALGISSGIMYRWENSSRVADRLYASVSAGGLRINLGAMSSGLWAAFWAVTHRTDSNAKFEISGWFQASAGA